MASAPWEVKQGKEPASTPFAERRNAFVDAEPAGADRKPQSISSLRAVTSARHLAMSFCT